MKKYRNRKGFKPLASRNEKLADRAPSDFSTQEIPRSLKEFIKLKESVKYAESGEEKQKAKSTSKSGRKNIPKNEAEVTKPQKLINMPQNQFSYDSDSTEERSNVVNRKNKQKRKKKLKLLKLQEKRKTKLLLEREKQDDPNEIVKDTFKFGEVVHRPPQLSVLPRKVAQLSFKNRPGRKDDLLLKSLLKQKHSK